MRPLLLLFALLAGAPAVGDVVCRPDALGSVSCPVVPRPKPRPPLFQFDVRGLDQVLPPRDARPGQEFVPARETDRLGGATILDRGTTICRPDQLGNLNCR